ncbi:MAG: MFS transporter [Oenococcus oeni]
MQVKKPKLLVFALAFGTFSILNTEVGVIGILPVISDKFNVTISQAGLLVSVFAIIVAVTAPFTPNYFARFEQKRILLTVLAAFMFSNILAATATSFSMVMIARLIPALVHPIYATLAFTIAAEAVPDQEASKAVSHVMVGVSAGMIFGLPVSTLIASNSSYSMVMLFFALVSGLALLLNFFLLPKIPALNKANSGTKTSSMSRIFRKKSLWISGLSTMLVGAALFVMYGYISDYLGRIGHFDGQTLSIALFLFGVASILGNLIAGSMLDSNGLKLVKLYSFMLSAVYIMVLLVANIQLLLILVVSLWGFVYGIGNNVQQYFISSAIPEAPTIANGLFISLGNVGTTLGTTIGGVILAFSSLQALPIAGCFILFVLYFIVIYRQKKFFSN